MATFTNGLTGPSPRERPPNIFKLRGLEQDFKTQGNAIECNLVFEFTSAYNTMISVLTIPEVEINHFLSQT